MHRFSLPMNNGATGVRVDAIDDSTFDTTTPTREEAVICRWKTFLLLFCLNGGAIGSAGLVI